MVFHFTEFFQEACRQRLFVRYSHGWADEKSIGRKALGVLLLDKLVIVDCSSKSFRHYFFNQLEEIRADECHAETSDLLKTAYGVEMLRIADGVKEASTPFGLQ